MSTADINFLQQRRVFHMGEIARIKKEGTSKGNNRKKYQVHRDKLVTVNRWIKELSLSS